MMSVSAVSGSGGSMSGTGSGTGSGISDLDPTFLRALRLLHSNSKDSLHQLKAMLDESLRLKKAASSGSSVSGSVVPASSGATSSSAAAAVSSSRDEQRKNFENLKRDLNDLMMDTSSSTVAKKPRLHGSP